MQKSKRECGLMAIDDSEYFLLALHDIAFLCHDLKMAAKVDNITVSDALKELLRQSIIIQKQLELIKLVID